MKIASKKKANPSRANGRPITSPKRPIHRGHKMPNSNDRIVPDTAPTAKSTPTALAHLRASVAYTMSPVRRPFHSAITTRNGTELPLHAMPMCAPSEKAICWRA